ncbi:uncharacterized protein LOC116176091 [Photinus pyralis]|uniref:Uncharacterized protein n=1 Tax=Photinus pyralis TaxID=7054 RepID=A0A1Y1MLX6_PHOPY|nr:uncharacterized protein LOC116176091 [Photinus pyralis]
MKVYALFCFVISASAVVCLEVKPEIKQLWDAAVEPFRDECTKSSGAQKAVVDDFFDHLNLIDDYPLKCVIKCVLDQLHIFDTSSKFNAVAMKDMMDEESFKVSQECDKKVTDSDKCVMAFEFVKCGLEGVAKFQ